MPETVVGALQKGLPLILTVTAQSGVIISVLQEKQLRLREVK